MNLTAFNSNAERKEANRPRTAFWHAFRNEIRQNVPFLIVLCLAYLLLILLPNALTAAQTYPDLNGQKIDQQTILYVIDQQWAEKSELVTYAFALSPCSVFLFPVLAFVLALIQFAYLTNRRAMDVYAALPIKRETAALARMTAGVGILLVPMALSYLLLFALNVLLMGFMPELLMELLFVVFASAVLMLIPYAVAALVAMLSGTLTENVLYPLVVLFAPVTMFLCVNALLEQNIYGYCIPYHLQSMVGFLFPYVLFWGERAIYFEGATNFLLTRRLENHQQAIGLWDSVTPAMGQLVLWFVLSLLLLAAAVFCCRRRKSETAGQRSASRLLTGVTQFLASALTGTLVLYISGTFWSEADLMYQLRYVLFIIGTLVGYGVFGLVVHHSCCAVLRRCQPYLCVLPVYGIFLAYMGTAGFGVYNAVPPVEDIAQAGINYYGDEGIMPSSLWYGSNGLFYYAQGNVEDEMFFTGDPDLLRVITDYNHSTIDQHGSGDAVQDTIRIQYRLKNGRTLSRCYFISDKESYRMLSELMNYPKFKFKTHYAYQMDFTRCKQIWVRDLYGTRSTALTAEQLDLAQFQNALQKDVANEMLDQLRYPEQPALGVVELELSGALENDFPSDVCVSIKAHYHNTIAYLQKAGCYDLLTPNYDAIEELTIAEPRTEDGRDSMMLCSGSIDTSQGIYAWDLFYPGYQSYDSYLSWYNVSESADQIVLRTVTDPQEIRKTLEHCYSQHALTDGMDRLVFVKSIPGVYNSAVELLMPDE